MKPYPRGENVRIIRCRDPHIGNDLSGQTVLLPPTGTVVEACTGTVTTEHGATFTTLATTTFPARKDSGAILWPLSKLGPNGVYSASD